MIKYRVEIPWRWDAAAEIIEVEVEKETDKSVWINGSRNAKVSEDANYYDTWEEAKDALVVCQKSRVNRLRSQLVKANSILGSIVELKKEIR